MNNEIEIKLAVLPKAFDVLAKHLQQFNPLEHERVFLANTYYDFPDRSLEKQKMGLRVRQKGEDFALTLKTNGDVVGGLHCRPEHSIPFFEWEYVTYIKFLTVYKVMLFSISDAAKRAELEALFDEFPKEHPVPIFSTDFNRTLWLVEFRDSKIEVAFDEGRIVNGERTQPICEIEFELKEGNVNDLFIFVEGLPFVSDIYFSSASKAKRGYQLGQSQVLTDWLNKWRDFLKAEREESAVDFKAKFNSVVKMEQDLVEETLSSPSSLFSQDFMKTVERVGAFFNLYHYYDENKKLLEAIVESKAETLLDENMLTNLLENNQYFLEEIRGLIRFHSETKDNEKTIEKLTALFKSRAYFERMIKFMALAV